MDSQASFTARARDCFDGGEVRQHLGKNCSMVADNVMRFLPVDMVMDTWGQFVPM